MFMAFAIILHATLCTLRLSAAPTANEDFVLSEIAKATNNIPRPDMSDYVKIDEDGTVTLRKNGSDDGAIVISPNTGYPYPSIRVRNPNWTDAYIFVGDGISINDTPNHGRTIRVDGTGYEGQRIDIGYSMEYEGETRCIPHITVDGTNLLETIGSSLASFSSLTSDVATLRADVDEMAAIVGAERTWNRPGDWTLAYLPLFTPSAETLVDITTNEIGMVFSNVTRRVAEGLSARVFSESLDEYSQAEPPAIVSLSVSGGGTAAGNVVTVPATGLYDVKGYAANGTARQIKVSFSGSEKSERATAYFDDAPAKRKFSNDYARSCLTGGEVRSGTDVDGNPYTIYDTTQPRFGAKNGWGNSVPYAIAPKFAATAAHYPNVPAARAGYAVTYNYMSLGSSGTYTIKSAGGAFNLATWALTNGFLEAEVAAAGISDVLIIPLQEGWEFPYDECPYFATEEWVTNNYGSLRGMTIWAVTQTSEYGIPMTVSSDDGNIYWQTASGLTPTMSYPRIDIARQIGYYNERNWWRVKVGDSGKPLWITYVEEDPGSGNVQWYDILLSHFHWVGGGPNFVKAAKIVKALCQQYQTYINIFE